MFSPIVEVGDTCGEVCEVNDARVLVDAADYYAEFYRAASHARRTICITGWQFDTRAKLVREQSPDGLPTEFLEFLSALCERNPELDVFITAWNYSVVYAIEREWFQNVRFGLRAHERVHFRFLDHPEPGGSHHIKLAVIDGELAFTGGIDICDERWDTRQHQAQSPHRVNAEGEPYGPFHDVQVAVTGPVVNALLAQFWKSWDAAAREGEELPRQAFAPSGETATRDWMKDCTRGLPLRAHRVGISRTYVGDEDDEGVFEIERLYLRAIHAAEQVIYFENQYFTSSAVVRALAERMQDDSKPALSVIFVLPDGGHSKKEQLVLGKRQRVMLTLVRTLADKHGHRLRVLNSRSLAADGTAVTTYIHAKVMIVDDRFVTIGSANLMNRSMRVDHELNLAFDTAVQQPHVTPLLEHDIRQLRASLLAEHSGLTETAGFLSAVGLVQRVDEQCSDPASKLVCKDVSEPDADDPILATVFDPSGPLDWAKVNAVFETLVEDEEGPVRGAARKMGQRLGVVDVDGSDVRVGLGDE